MESWLPAEMDTVPEYDAFLGADELESALADIAARHPDVAALHRVGTSRAGDPIHALRVGDASRHALVFGLPHPNEPIGGLSALHLAERLCADPALLRRLDLTFTVVACIDPDGLRLNEGWLKGPFTRTHYARHFYRPAGAEQVEWTFPLSYKRAWFDRVLPETLVLMRLIDELQPALVCSLHNSELGGAYYYLSRAEPALYQDLQEIPERVGVPLDRGEPEHPSIPRLADGVYLGLGVRHTYDYLEDTGQDPLVLAEAGDTSAAYAERHGSLTLISEVPYWTDPRSSDPAPTEHRYAALLAEQGTRFSQFAEPLQEALAEVRPHMVTESPFLRASLAFIPWLTTHEESLRPRVADPANQRPATVAEQFSLADTVHSFRLRYGGMLLRATAAELAAGNQPPVIRRRHAELRDLMEQWMEEAQAHSAEATLPIRALVATQYAAMLAAARHVTTDKAATSRTSPT